jgi:hypothetical protein
MDERMQFVARRRTDGGTLQGVWNLSQDGLQDLRVALQRLGITLDKSQVRALCEFQRMHQEMRRSH